MDSPSALYESQLRRITDVCTDPWFAEQLAAFRAGDELAWRRISGSCLFRVLDIAKRKWQPRGPLALFDLVQEGNNLLVSTIKGFEGTTANEFLRELTQKVEQRLTLLVEHPEPPA
jgi:hypothetical protein